MIVTIKRGDDIISKHDSTKNSSTYRKMRNGRPVETPYEYRERKRHEMKVRVIRPSEDVSEERVEDTTETSSQTYDNSQFNQGWASENVPSVDDMYRDLKVTINNPRKKKVQISSVYGEFANNNIDENLIKYSDPVPVPEKEHHDQIDPLNKAFPYVMDKSEPIDTVAREIHIGNEKAKEEEEEKPEFPIEVVQECIDHQDPDDNVQDEEQLSKEEMYPNATQLVNIVYDTDKEEEPHITEDEILSEF